MEVRLLPGPPLPASFSAKDAPVLTERRRLNSSSGDQLGRRERWTLARLLSGVLVRVRVPGRPPFLATGLLEWPQATDTNVEWPPITQRQSDMLIPWNSQIAALSRFES